MAEVAGQTICAAIALDVELAPHLLSLEPERNAEAVDVVGDAHDGAAGVEEGEVFFVAAGGLVSLPKDLEECESLLGRELLKPLVDAAVEEAVAAP